MHVNQGALTASTIVCTQSEPLAALLCKCAAAEEQAHDLQLNVVAALGQLARDQEPTARALASPAGVSADSAATLGSLHTPCQHLQRCLCRAALLLRAALSSLLLLADSQQPSKLQEAVADGLCALASKEWAREQLYAAGACDAGAACTAAFVTRRLAKWRRSSSSSAAPASQSPHLVACLRVLLQVLLQRRHGCWTPSSSTCLCAA